MMMVSVVTGVQCALGYSCSLPLSICSHAAAMHYQSEMSTVINFVLHFHKVPYLSLLFVLLILEVRVQTLSH